MKLKYYLRGLGIGIVVAALLMGFTKSGSKESLTDEEIIARATQLGMVESSVLSADLKEDGVKEPEAGTVVPEAETEPVKEEKETGMAVDKEPVTESATEEKETGAATESQKEPPTEEKETGTKTETPTEQKETATATETESPKEPATKTETPTKPATEQKGLFITVYGGDGSRAVADRMEQAGMIEDAAAFDEFLCQNGYDKRLTTGEHEIKAGASFKDMAEALVKKQN